MVNVESMTPEEMQNLLQRSVLGHLGCTRDDHPYVVAMHYAYDSQGLYFFTTEGTKTEFIAANSEVCFQVEEIIDPARWQSVMVMGRAESVTMPGDVEHAMQLITERNPALTPAVNRTGIGAWKRPSKVMLYRVRPRALYGRKTV